MRLLVLIACLQLVVALKIFEKPSRDPSIAPPPGVQKAGPYRQVSRQEIVYRNKVKARRASRVGALHPRQSQVNYPACTSQSNYNAIPGTGFANLGPWYIIRTAPYDVPGSWRGVNSVTECISLCQQQTSCDAVFYDPNARTCSQRTNGIPPGTYYRSFASTNVNGIQAIRGTCAELAAAINNSTIMAACCDNPRPSVSICPNSDFQNLGQTCVRSQTRMTGNVLSSRLVTAGTARAGYSNCYNACVTTTANAYAAQGTSTYCTGVLYDNGRTIDNRYNCYLQANRLTAIAATQNTGTVSFMSGLCQQQQLATSVYSASYLARPYCDSIPPLSA